VQYIVLFVALQQFFSIPPTSFFRLLKQILNSIMPEVIATLRENLRRMRRKNQPKT
jgi:hypothetical protein